MIQQVPRQQRLDQKISQAESQDNYNESITTTRRSKIIDSRQETIQKQQTTCPYNLRSRTHK